MNQDFITVVSGLPRSGTSMMMRMLSAGGLPLLTDGFRQADEDNPHGYFEYEAVKRLDKNSSWLPEAYRKGIKIIYAFLYQLPPVHHYRVLFMTRNAEEVVASQKKMLRRRQEGDRLTDQQLIESFTQQLEDLDRWLRQQKNFQVHYFDHQDVVADPMQAAREIRSFLALPLDVEAMAQSVDTSLYRNRSAAE